MRLLSVLLVPFLLVSQAAKSELKTVPYVDPARYLGTWYQIARNPLFFERGCVCSRQVLSPSNEGPINVYNSCNSNTPDGELIEIRGTATNDDPSTNARFTVDFNLPNKGQYWIIGLDDDYRYAVVSDPTLKSLYILSKTPELAPELYRQAVAKAAEQVDTSKLLVTLQAGCSYPPEARVTDLPKAPTNPEHPGSKIYNYSFVAKTLRCNNRDVSLYIPSAEGAAGPFPVVVYGHGQALGIDSYEGTVEHLAQKGVAVVFPNYDTGFFDQDWRRMGRDYTNLADCAIKASDNKLNREQLVFSGHSKGAYVASVAAGLAFQENLSVKPKAVVLFEAAGYDNIVSKIDPATSVTVVFSDQDTVVKRDLSESIFNAVTSTRKQFIFVKSYPSLKADHMWPLTKGSFFGGGPESALHYYGAWKWLTAAALDLRNAKYDNPYLYGAMAGDKGVDGLHDDVRRNF